MSPLLSLIPTALTFSVAMLFRRRANRNNALREDAQAKADSWMLRAIRAEDARYPTTLGKLSDAKVAKLYVGIKHGFPDEFPPNFPVGTSSNPIRVHAWTDHEDTARYSELSALCPRVLP